MQAFAHGSTNGSLDELKALAQKKKVPVHHYSYWYFLGGMTLFLFGVQVLTGALLLLYYRPGADEAFESVQFIMTQVQFGWLIRLVHWWSANLLVFMAFAHLFSVLFLRSYRKPRELTWVSNRTQTFDANDTYAHSWIKLINVYSPSHNISWTWLTPWGQAYAKYNVTIPDPGSGRYYQNYYADSSISIKGSSALYLAGAWHVNVYIDGALALLQNFSLESPYLTPQGIRSA